MNVAIIGSGIIGLSCAWRLAQRGCRVTTFDGNRESQEASWTAAGMLAPHNEAIEPDALWRLCSSSLERWGPFVEDLGFSAQELDYHRHGSLTPIFNDGEKRALAQKVESMSKAGVSFEWRSSRDLAIEEPALRGAQLLGAYAIEGGHVDPRKVCSALRQRCLSFGVELNFETHVSRASEGEVTLMNGERRSFDHVVLAAGAWTPALASLTGITLKGEPVKGQMIRFAPHAGPRLSRFVHCEHAYAVQRQDGSLVIGSTMENTGFDKSENQESIDQLIKGAQRLMPHLKNVPLSETWTGLRPKLNGGLPLFQTVSPQLTITTGHYRNGILLAPISSDIVTELVLEGKTSVDVSAFQFT